MSKSSLDYNKNTCPSVFDITLSRSKVMVGVSLVMGQETTALRLKPLGRSIDCLIYGRSDEYREEARVVDS